jgi:hypothetical protein
MKSLIRTAASRQEISTVKKTPTRSHHQKIAD